MHFIPKLYVMYFMAFWYLKLALGVFLGPASGLRRPSRPQSPTIREGRKTEFRTIFTAIGFVRRQTYDPFDLESVVPVDYDRTYVCLVCFTLLCWELSQCEIRLWRLSQSVFEICLDPDLDQPVCNPCGIPHADREAEKNAVTEDRFWDPLVLTSWDPQNQWAGHYIESMCI